VREHCSGPTKLEFKSEATNLGAEQSDFFRLVLGMFFCLRPFVCVCVGVCALPSIALAQSDEDTPVTTGAGAITQDLWRLKAPERSRKMLTTGWDFINSHNENSFKMIALCTFVGEEETKVKDAKRAVFAYRKILGLKIAENSDRGRAHYAISQIDKSLLNDPRKALDEFRLAVRFEEPGLPRPDDAAYIQALKDEIAVLDDPKAFDEALASRVRKLGIDDRVRECLNNFQAVQVLRKPEEPPVTLTLTYEELLARCLPTVDDHTLPILSEILGLELVAAPSNPVNPVIRKFLPKVEDAIFAAPLSFSSLYCASCIANSKALPVGERCDYAQRFIAKFLPIEQLDPNLVMQAESFIKSYRKLFSPDSDSKLRQVDLWLDQVRQRAASLGFRTP
jgi:hypothetical protein